MIIYFIYVCNLYFILQFVKDIYSLHEIFQTEYRDENIILNL